jgi:hypothetical protein
MPARTKAPKKVEPAPPAAPEPTEDLAARLAAAERDRDEAIAARDAAVEARTQLEHRLASATWERDVLREDNLRLRGEKAELQDRVKLFQLTTGVSAVGNVLQALFGRR